MSPDISRRDAIKAIVAGGVATVAAVSALQRPESAEAKEVKLPPFEQGHPQTYPRMEIGGELVKYNRIGLSNKGPDDDTVASFDFAGVIPSGAKIVFAGDNPTETRVTFIMRQSMQSLEIHNALGGDSFEMHKISEWGMNDADLQDVGLQHAQDSARLHMVNYFLGDIGPFMDTYGAQEQTLLQTMFASALPAKAGIPTPDFVK